MHPQENVWNWILLERGTNPLQALVYGHGTHVLHVDKRNFSVQTHDKNSIRRQGQAMLIFWSQAKQLDNICQKI